MDDLICRRQFVMGPRPIPRLATWSTWTIGDDFVVQTHPDLPCLQKTAAGKTLTLIGLVVDSDRPHRGADEVLASLLDGGGTLDDLFAASAGLAGRWIIIAEMNGQRVLFQDACGLRTAVYTKASDAERWCGSQTSLLADELDLTMDPEAVDFWNESGTRIPKHIRAWPGAGTAYADVDALLPNHYLDLRTWAAVRFFPKRPLEALSLEDGTERIARRLVQSLTGAHGNGPVVQEITAGLDSRCLLAASREVSADTLYITGLWTDVDPTLTDTHRDVAVPANLLRALNLRHEIVRATERSADPALDKAYETSDTLPTTELAQRNRAIAHALPAFHLLINGNGGEIGRCRLHPTGHPQTVSLDHACNLHWPGLYKHPYLRRHLEPWLAETGAAADAAGYRLLDLFYWEQKMARRVGKLLLHADIVHETYSPYNTRALLCEFLSVPEEYRKPANNLPLQHAIIERLWPEALDVPINPLTRSDKAARFVRRLRRHARGFGLPV